MEESDFFKDLEPEQQREILAIGGGKGGTGKSFFTANLGILLARMGKRVIRFDADLGCANLHTCLGIPNPETTLSDFFQGRVKHLRDVISPTEIPNLTLISGAHDILDSANPIYSQKMRLLRMINDLEFDYILLDLGAGTSYNMLDFFLLSDNGIVPVTPETTSIENVYRFIKAAFYRRFKQLVKSQSIREIISMAMDQKNARGIKTPYDLIEQIVVIDESIGKKIQRALVNFKPKLIVNKVRSSEDLVLGNSITRCCSQYFGIQMEYLGFVEYDNLIWQTTKKNRPLVLEYPYSHSARSLEKIAHNLIKSGKSPVNGLMVPMAASF